MRDASKFFIILLFPLLILLGCSGKPELVEVTRIVQVTAEVTQPNEVIIEATDTFRDLFYRYEAVVVTRVEESEKQATVGRQILALLTEDVEGIEQLTLIGWSEGLLEIELLTAYAGKADQPGVSWEVVKGLSRVLAGITPGQRFELTGSRQLDVLVRTYSVLTDYPYQSRTDIETLLQIEEGEISRETWVDLSGAAFQ